MKTSITASRAILAAYARKTLLPVEIIAIIIFVVAMFGTTYLIVSVSAWWWLLMTVVLLYGLIGSVLWLILHITLDRITPKQSESQKQAVRELVIKTEKLAEHLGVSQFGLVLRVARDVMYRRHDNIITEFARDSGDLKQAFERVLREFGDTK